MGVVEQVPGDNSIGKRGLKRQKVTKEPMAEAAPTAEKLGEVGGTTKPMPSTDGLEEAGGPEKARGPKEVRGVEEAERLEEVEELEGTEGTEEPVPAVERPKEVGGSKEVGGTGKSKSVAGELEEGGGLKELAAALLLSWSDCWQAFALATTLFSCCFSFLNCLIFFCGSLSSLFSLSPTTIASSITLSSPNPYQYTFHGVSPLSYTWY